MSKWFRSYYKNPHTHNEAKHNQDEWARAKRRPANLADAWDDRPRCIQRTWKEHRRTKYRPGKRGQKHTIFCEGYLQAWDLKEYCDKHDIPFEMEHVRQAYKTAQVPIKKPRLVGQKLVYIRRQRKVLQADGTYTKEWVREPWFYRDVYEYDIVGYRTVTYHEHVGYNCTWWSDKDIGIEYILNREHRY